MSNKNQTIDTLNTLKKTCIDALRNSNSLELLEEVRIEYLGRKGKIADVMTLLKDLSVEEKRTQGPLLNSLKQEAEAAYYEQKNYLETKKLEEKEALFKDFDTTAYLPEQLTGSLHPHTLATQRVQEIFKSMGYKIATGPEVETDFFNFEALNIPKNHPARDMQDTFWTEIPDLVLRTHTSNVQIHEMRKGKLPLAVIMPGRVFRQEATDASHDYMFHQVEGLFIDKNVSMSHLIGTVKAFLQAFFEQENLKIRLRPSYFPFVEPGIEIDMSCPFCTSGCSTCKRSTWIEIMGAGLVHPNVLKHGNIDSTIYSGFAFGFGLTRLTCLKYKINDIRLMHSSQKEFLKQF